MAEQQTLKDELGELSSIMNNISIAIDKHIEEKKAALPAFGPLADETQHPEQLRISKYLVWRFVS